MSASTFVELGELERYRGYNEGELLDREVEYRKYSKPQERKYARVTSYKYIATNLGKILTLKLSNGECIQEDRCEIRVWIDGEC